jgi:hypothetical protein
MNDLILAEISAIDASRRWGDSFSLWSEPFEPSVMLQVFAPENGKVMVSIQTEDGKEIQQFSAEVDKGLNMLSYDVTLSEKGIKALEKSGTKPNKAKNNKYYLPKGKYTIVISQNEKTAKTAFEVN